MIQAGSQVFAPVECIDVADVNGLDVVSLPWAQVKGAQLIINSIDNYDTVDIGSGGPAYWAALEVTVWGTVQGYATCLKRQHVRMLTGPMLYRVDGDEFYNYVTVKARNMSGGVSGGSTEGGLSPPRPSSQLGFSLKCQVMLTAQQGIGGR